MTDILPTDPTESWQARYEHALMNTFGTPARLLVRGLGAEVWDDQGKRYLDLLAGIAVNSLGHAHPALLEAVSLQMSQLGHISNLFASLPQITLAERLISLAQAPAGSRVFFTNSGAEANEAALKMARRLTSATGRPGRIIALTGAFHGRTLGALSLTHKLAYRQPFEPLPGPVQWLEPGDDQALKAAFSPQEVAASGPVLAMFVESIQGEAGVHPLPPGYLALARDLTRQAGALLIVDEVQTGIGRTGWWLACHNPDIAGIPASQDHGDQAGHDSIVRDTGRPDTGRQAAGRQDITTNAAATTAGIGMQDIVVPDIVTLAKGLGGGFPLGAVIAYGPQAASLLTVGQHGSTFAGNPVAAAAGLAVLDTIDSQGLLAHVQRTGALIRDSIEAAGHPLISHVRGQGLLLAVVLTEPLAAQVARHALDQGLIVNAVAPDAIRLAPPLILSSQQALEAARFFTNLDISSLNAKATS